MIFINVANKINTRFLVLIFFYQVMFSLDNNKIYSQKKNNKKVNVNKELNEINYCIIGLINNPRSMFFIKLTTV